MTIYSEQERIEKEYIERDNRFSYSDYYSLINPYNLFRAQSLERNLMQVLRKKGFYPLKDLNVLEVGCGNGNILIDFLTYGVPVTQLNGIDLLSFRLHEGKNNWPFLRLSRADGQNLPFASGSYDLVLQFTVLSSVLINKIKVKIAQEMVRVLRPGGMIIWYDFWLNPTNKETRGIRPIEIRRLFPNCAIDLKRITLAPPLARQVVPFSWGFAYLIEQVRLFNTHYLAAIRPMEQ